VRCKRWWRVLRTRTDTDRTDIAVSNQNDPYILDPWWWHRQVVPKRRYEITNLRCVISQKVQISIQISLVPQFCPYELHHSRVTWQWRQQRF